MGTEFEGMVEGVAVLEGVPVTDGETDDVTVPVGEPDGDLVPDTDGERDRDGVEEQD